MVLTSLSFLILLYHLSIGFSMILLFCNKIVTFSCSSVLLLCFEWRFSALPYGAYAECGLIHSFLALCAFSTVSTVSTGFQQNIAQ
jgi:hypothetical protein